MNYRQLAWGAGAGCLLLAAIFQPWHHTDTTITTRGIDGDPAQHTPDGQGAARIVIGQSHAAIPAADTPPSISPAAETDIDLNLVYTELFNADPQTRGDTLAIIAQRPEVFSNEDRFALRLEEMTEDHEPAVAEQAALVLVQLMGARVEDEIPPSSAAWVAARTTFPETAVTVAPDYQSEAPIDADPTREAVPLSDTRQATIPDHTRMTMAADAAVAP